MWTQFKKWIFDRHLPQSVVKEKVAGVNPQQNVAILFDGTNEEDRKTVHAFKKLIKSAGSSRVKSLAFINNKLPLDNVDYAAYNLKDTRWYGQPSGENVEEFIRGHWDLVIFLGYAVDPHFEYIMKMVNASFIIGISENGHVPLFDLTVEVKKEDSLEKRIQTTVRSIDIISSKYKK